MTKNIDKKITLVKISKQVSKSPKFSCLRGWSPYVAVGTHGFFSTQIGQKGIEEHVLALTGWEKTGPKSYMKIPQKTYENVKNWSEGSTQYYILESIENPGKYLHIKSEFVKISPEKYDKIYSNTTIQTGSLGQRLSFP